MGKPYVRREAQLKAEVLQIVERSPLPVRQTLQELQIAPSTYYRWKSRYRDKGFNGLVDRPPEPRRVWNRLATKQRRYVVRYALEHPSLSPREVATTLVDEQVMYVSESTVYRILKEAGLIKPPSTKGFPAGKEFHTKTARPNELWQTDASYFFVVGWGYYYLISVLDDYSRMIVGWRVQTSMSSADIIEVVQDAVEFTGQPTAPVEPGPALLSDNGPGFLSRALDEFLRARFMKHIFASPFHPQTNGKLERYHRTAKAKVNVFVHHSLEELVAAMEGFVRYYNYERYHECFGNQRKWDTLRPERLEIGRGLGELPEGLVVAPSPFDCVSLHLLPALQYPFPPPVEHICRCHIAQRLVIAPVVVVGHEGGKGSLQIGSHLVGDLLDVSLDSLVIALQLAVGLRVEGCSPDVLDSHQAQVVSEATGHIS